MQSKGVNISKNAAVHQIIFFIDYGVEHVGRLLADLGISAELPISNRSAISISTKPVSAMADRLKFLIGWSSRRKTSGS